MKILAVDDDPVILELLMGAMAAQDGYELICCDSAENAQQLLNDKMSHFDCFLLDVMLPGIDGIELCDIVRNTAKYRTTPIIMITASRAPDLMNRAFSAGATDFVSKPLSGVELGARINAAGMLNDSLHRERLAQHTLEELSRKTKLRFEESIAIESAEVTSLLELENDLLRMPAGGYAMNLFTVDVMGLRGTYRMVTPTQFRHQIDSVASAAFDALGETKWKMAYAGGGRFMGLIMARKPLDSEGLMREMSANMAQNWDAEKSGVPLAPELKVNRIGDRRIWSGRSASSEFRENILSNDMLEVPQVESEDRLFEKLDAAIQ